MNELPTVNSLDAVFEKLGGPKGLAERFNVGVTAPYNWKARGKLPSRLHYRMDREAEREGFAIDPSLFGEEAA